MAARSAKMFLYHRIGDGQFVGFASTCTDFPGVNSGWG